VQQLPGPLRLPPSYPFVGRSAELAALRALVPREAGERGRLALLGGEAGSGKSRLVRELAQEVSSEGVHVLYGACDAVVHTPYRPFAEALDQLVRDTEPEMLRADLGSAGGELARLLPDLPARVGGLPAPVTADPDTERHRLHTAVTDLLAGAARRRPLLLVLEDGHWADTPTLVLLRHLARASSETRMLVLTTFRDTEADVPSELADALADLRRSDDVVRLRLEGLSEAEIEEFVRRAGGGEVDPAEPELSRALRELTEGNAFLLCELWRALIETGAFAVEEGTLRLTAPLREIATPQSVHEVVGQRLNRLDPASRDLLELAAVAGPEFELDVLRRAAPSELERIDALEPAMHSGMIEELPFPALAYRFTHELVRRALYDRLSVLRRAELHLRIAEALEGLVGPGGVGAPGVAGLGGVAGPDAVVGPGGVAGPGDAGSGGVAGRPQGRVLAGLAHHFAAAAPIGGPERAVRYSLLAAQAASAALDYDEASAHLRTALRLGVADAHQRVEVLLDEGTALFRAGRSLDSLRSFRAAAEIARDLGEGALLARAAIGFETSCWRPGLTDQGARELLEEASVVLAREDSTLRVGLLASLTRALEYEGSSVQASRMRAEAIAMARRIDDRPGLATALIGVYWGTARGGLSGSKRLTKVLEMLGEARELAVAMGDVEGQAEATQWRFSVLVALGEIAPARAELALALDMAQHTRQPFILHVAEHYRSMMALLEGELAQAEMAAERSHEWSRLFVGRDASGVYGIQMFGVRREQGRLAELAPVMRVLAAGDRAGGAWRPGLVAMLAELAMEEQVRDELSRVQAEGLEPLREGLWLASLTYLADAAAAVAHKGVAALLYPLLAPLAGTNVMIGHGVACYGAADRYLGMLAATLGDSDGATGHFEAALQLNRRMGARTWLAHTAYEYGRMLLAQGAGERAERLLAEAALLAETVGMPTLLARTRALTPTSIAPLPDGLSTRELDVLRLVARGRSNREIGATLFISEHTAANHVRSILRKTTCANRTEAAAYAFRRRLVQD
jgi:DNA-binding CsgD family transcriptional regulator/tetratricopeptide (TPR) repeat protein